MGKVAGFLAIVGGAMLIVGGFTGYTTLGNVKTMVEKWMPNSDIKENVILVLTILIFFALLGGISVLLGGYMCWKGHDIIGKILIMLGAGVGIMSIVVSAIVAYVSGKWDAFVASNLTLNVIGLVLAAVARRLA
jgi:hypothetical protein